MSAPVYYLSHPYTGNPKESFQNAVDWTGLLRAKYEVVVFSPILHTHQFHLESCKRLKAVDKFGASNKVIDEEINHRMDYICWDLALLKALMAGDGCNETYWCPKHGGSYTHNNEMRCDWLEEKECRITLTVEPPKFDSGVVLLLDEGAIEVVCNTCQAGYNLSDKEMCNPYECTHGCRWRWLSDGCRQDYEFCKDPKNCIRTCSLQHFINTGELKEL